MVQPEEKFMKSLPKPIFSYYLIGKQDGLKMKFVKHLILLPNSKQPKNNKSYEGLVSAVFDLILCAKFKFVEMLSWKFKEFLRVFQTNRPMVLFLFSALDDFLR